MLSSKQRNKEKKKAKSKNVEGSVGIADMFCFPWREMKISTFFRCLLQIYAFITLTHTPLKAQASK